MTHCPTAVLANLTVLALCAAGVAQQDVAGIEFAERKELHAAEPAVGTRVPDLVLVSLEGRPVALTSLRGRYVVAIRAGYTSQPFRDAAAGLKLLQGRFAKSPIVTVLVVVTREPAAEQAPFETTAQPKTLAERIALAERMRDELGLTMSIYVDGMDDASLALFSDPKNSVALVDREGLVADRLPGADAEPLGRAVERAQRTSKPARFPDSGPMTFDERDASMRIADLDPPPLLRVNWGTHERKTMREAEADAELQARRALTRARLFRSRNRTEWDAARAAVLPAIEAAWSKNQLRLLAARVEFAELLETCGDGEGWTDLLRKPPEGADARTLAWIHQKQAAFEAPLLDFDEARRNEVRELRKCQPSRDGSTILGIPRSFVRVRFVPEGLLLLRDAERLGLQNGDVAHIDYGMPDDVEKLAGKERTVLLSQSHILVRYKSWLHAVGDR